MLDDREAEARAGPRLRARPVDLVEALEDLVPLGLRDPGPEVLDREARTGRPGETRGRRPAPPSGENLIALSSRLRASWPRRRRSPIAVTLSSPVHADVHAAFAGAGLEILGDLARAAPSAEISSRTSGTAPLSICARSIRSSMSSRIRSDWRRIRPSSSARLGPVGLVPRPAFRRPPRSRRSACAARATRRRRTCGASTRCARGASRRAARPTAAARCPSGSGATAICQTRSSGSRTVRSDVSPLVHRRLEAVVERALAQHLVDSAAGRRRDARSSRRSVRSPRCTRSFASTTTRPSGSRSKTIAVRRRSDSARWTAWFERALHALHRAAEQLDFLAARRSAGRARSRRRRPPRPRRVSSAIGSEKRREAPAPIRKSRRQTATIARRIVQR